MKIIETIENWNILKAAMKEKGYKLWQTQYSADMPEGFHAWFMHAKNPDVEVVTHNTDVQRSIIKSNSE